MSTDRLPTRIDEAGEAVPAPSADHLSERLIRHTGRAASVAAVFGAPMTAHGRTVIPVARTHFLLGGGEGRGEGRAGRHDPALGSAGARGGGGGGLGWTVAQGYIELSPEGTRYVAFSDRRGRLIGALGGLLLGVALSRLFRR